jgi:hypothetical protein
MNGSNTKFNFRKICFALIFKPFFGLESTFYLL